MLINVRTCITNVTEASYSENNGRVIPFLALFSKWNIRRGNIIWMSLNYFLKYIISDTIINLIGNLGTLIEEDVRCIGFTFLKLVKMAENGIAGLFISCKLDIMSRRVRWVMALLVIQVVWNKQSVFGEDYNSDAEDIISFLELHSEYCSGYSVCSLHATGKLDNTRYCCHACSCDDDCEEKDECCPDYWIVKQLNISQSYNVSSVIQEIRVSNINNTQPNENDTKRRDAESVSGDENKICSSVSVPELPMFDHVKMVTSCPKNWTDPVKRRKCENPQNKNGTFSQYEHIPASCKGSHIVYRNVNCMLCNFETSENCFVWDVYLRLYEEGLHEKRKNAKNIGEIISRLLTKAGTRLHFKSPDDSVKVENCFINMIDNCNMTAPEISNAMQLSRVCTRFKNPITTSVGSSWLTFKNIACLLCNADVNKLKKARRYCNIHEKTTDLRIIPNVYQNRNTQASDDIHIIAKNFTKSSKCGLGYVLDKTQKRCRIVECPKYFYTQDGECAPLFDFVENAMYHVKLEAEPTKPLTSSQTRLFDHLLKSKISSFFDNSYLLTINILRMPEAIANIKVPPYFISIITPSETTTLQMFLKALSRVVTEQLVIKINTLFSSDILEVDCNFSQLTIEHIYKVSNGSKILEYKGITSRNTVFPDGQQQIDGSTPFLNILHTNLCYMVYIDLADYTALNRGVIKILETGKIVNLAGTVFSGKLDGSLFTCLENLFPEQTLSLWDPSSTEKPSVTTRSGVSRIDDTDDAFTLEMKGLTAIIFLVVVFCLLVGLHKLRQKALRN